MNDKIKKAKEEDLNFLPPNQIGSGVESFNKWMKLKQAGDKFPFSKYMNPNNNFGKVKNGDSITYIG